MFTGYAVGNLDGIKRVEISFDNGKTWKPTALFSNPSPIVWSFWKYTWVNPKRGKYRIRVRAIDGKGRIEGGATGQQVLTVAVT